MPTLLTHKTPQPDDDPLAHLPPSSLHAFASLLRFQPLPQQQQQQQRQQKRQQQAWLDAQRAAIADSAFPADLLCGPRRGHNIHAATTTKNNNDHGRLHLCRRLLLLEPLRKLGGGGSSSGGQEQQRLRLCAAHERLDGRLVGQCLGLLAAEVSVRVDVVRGFVRQRRRERQRTRQAGEAREKEEEDEEQVAAVLDEYVQSLGGVATLWLVDADFDGAFGRAAARPEFRFDRRPCPACVLAVVGGHADVLVALRANMLARAKRRMPRLLALVEAWMRVWGAGCEADREADAAAEAEAAMRADSERLAGVVRSVRVARQRKEMEREEEGQSGGKRGRSKHRGGLPAATRFVHGLPVPQVRLHGDLYREQQQQQQQHETALRGERASRTPYPASGGTVVNGARDVETSSSQTLVGGGGDAEEEEEEEKEREKWELFSSSSAISSTSSNDDNDDDDFDEVNSDGEFIPARRNWPRARYIPRMATAVAGQPSSSSIYSNDVGSAADNNQNNVNNSRNNIKPSSVLASAPRPSEYAGVQDETARMFHYHSGDAGGQPSSSSPSYSSYSSSLYSTLYVDSARGHDGSQPSQRSMRSTGTNWADFYRGRAA